MTTNLSAFIDGKDQPLRVAESPIPKPGPDDIIIKQYPAVVGVDIAGDVYEVGSDVSRFKQNDRVIVHAGQFMTGLPEDGAFSLFCRIPAANAALLPQEIWYIQGVVLPLAIDTAAGGFYQPDYVGFDFPSSTARPGVTILKADSSPVLEDAITTRTLSAGSEATLDGETISIPAY
ncbi:hypothetical protein LTR56_027489 [Elasticomyces elasticus]|nr:hypothetical protein LTR56_027489 [Elasticomyces elasticus]